MEQLLLDAPSIRQLDDRVTDIIHYIQSNDLEHLGYQDVVSSVYLSKSRLTHLFKDEMGISLLKYLTWKRLIHATKELAISGKSITETAYRYGFSDAAHFSRVFKDNFGVSPSRIFSNKQKDDRLIHVFTVNIS